MLTIDNLEKTLAQNKKTKEATGSLRATIGGADDETSMKLLHTCNRSDARINGQETESIFELWSFLQRNNLFARFKSIGLECQ